MTMYDNFATDAQRRMLRAVAASRGLTVPTSAQLSNLSKRDVSDARRQLDDDIDVFGDGHRPFDATPIPPDPAADPAAARHIEIVELLSDLLAIAMQIRNRLPEPTDRAERGGA